MTELMVYESGYLHVRMAAAVRSSLAQLLKLSGLIFLIVFLNAAIRLSNLTDSSNSMFKHSSSSEGLLVVRYLITLSALSLSMIFTPIIFYNINRAFAFGLVNQFPLICFIIPVKRFFLLIFVN